jgi:hypothetical protein
MANRYWVGGTASWDGTAGTKWATTSGAGGGASVPTSADDVFFDAASGAVTCTIATGNTDAKSIDCTGFTGTITGTAAISVAGSITLVAGQTYTHTGTVTLTGTGTLTTAGKSFSTLVVDGVGITVTLGDAFTSNFSITVTRGTLDTANYNVTGSSLSSSNSNTRTITLGSSTCSFSAGTPILLTTATNLTFNAGTSQINCSNVSPTFGGGSQTFYNVSFTGTSIGTRNITGSNTFNNLSFSSLSSDGISFIQISANQTVNGTLTLGTTNAAVRRMFVFSNTIGTSRTITAAAIATLSDVDFRDITAAGASGTWSGTRLGNCLGNTNITFDAGKTVYWNLTGSQTWLSTGWALGSGGTPSVNNFPLAQDTAIFDDAGAAQTVNLPSTNTFGAFNYGTIDMSTRTTSFTFGIGATTNHYGSLILSSAITLTTGGFTLSFLGRGVTQTFTSAGKSFVNGITINNLTGNVVLGSALTQTNNAITLTSGTFDAASYNVTTPQFSSSNSNTRTLTLGNGLWTLTGTGTVWTTATTTGLTFNKGTSDILLSDTSTTSRTFSPGALTYNKVTIGGATGTSTLTYGGTSGTVIGELASTKTVAHTINIGNTNSGTITTWSVTGTAGNVVTVNSSSAGTQRSVTVTNKTINIDYLSVTDINSTNLDPVTFYAGANSTNSGNTIGVAFIARTTASPQNAYILTSGTTFTVPVDWNNSNNTIHLFGGGGGGSGPIYVATTSFSGGAGGGGGGYRSLTNQTYSGSVTYAIGAAGSGAAGGTSGTSTGGTGGTTTWDPSFNTISNVANEKVQLTSASTTITINVPTGTADGDLLIAVLIGTSASAAWTTPSGWTAGITLSQGRAVFYKTAASEPASYTFTFGQNVILQGYLLTYRNAQWGVNGTIGALTTPADASAITTTVNNSVIFYYVSTGSGTNITFSTPTGYTLLDSDSDLTIPASAIFTTTQAIAGTTGTVSSTPSTGTARASLFAIYPTIASYAGTATGGVGGVTTATTSTGGAGGTGTSSGGTGGNGDVTISGTNHATGGGGGGGAAGPNGAGGNGGNGFNATSNDNNAGGGGGGNGGGTSGGNAVSNTGGPGGNNSLGSGGAIGAAAGVPSTTASNGGGGGGGGGNLAASAGSNGSENSGGGGGGSGHASSGTGGLYGAGGGGGGSNITGTRQNGANGRQGAIFIVYTPISTTNNFFLMF